MNYFKDLLKEFKAGLLVALGSSFLLAGYEAVRSPTNTLFKEYYGPENLPTVLMIMPLGVLLVLYVYGRMISLLGPRKTLLITTLGSGLILAFCHYLLQSEFRPAIWFLYIFREAYIVLIIEQYWSFIDSRFKADLVKKYSGFILAISSVGATLGGLGVGAIAPHIGTVHLILIAALMMIPCAFFPQWGFAIIQEKSATMDTPKEPETKSDHLGIRTLTTSPLLMKIVGLIIFTQVLSTMHTLNFQGALHNFLPNPDQQTSYSGYFFSAVNGAAMFLQLVGIPLAFKLFQPFTIHLLLPAVNIVAALIALIYPSLTTIAAALLIFKSLDYSIFRVAKEVLYIPLSFDARYRAKEIIDVFGYRFSKGGTSLAVVFVQKAGVAMAGLYAPIAVAAGLVWGWTAINLKKNSEKPTQAS